jgi:hypothetical protein
MNGSISALRFFFTVTLDRTNIVRHLEHLPGLFCYFAFQSRAIV